MQISIKERLKPFSHTPGTCSLLPATPFFFRVFPTKFVVEERVGKEKIVLTEVCWEIKGPVKDFTVQLDLEKGGIRVWGRSEEGFFRYKLLPEEAGSSFVLHIEKAPPEGIRLKGLKEPVKAKQSLCFSGKPLTPSRIPNEANPFKRERILERLSFGSHKKQDWDLVKRRLDLKEILPVWHRLGKWTPPLFSGNSEGNFLLLQQLKESILKREKLKIAPLLENIFQAGFDSLFSPRVYDDQYQGLSNWPLSEAAGKESPLPLLTEGKDLLENLFFKCEENALCYLPLLPPEFPCGRMVGVVCGKWGVTDFEWSKKMIRRIVFRSSFSGSLLFVFQKRAKSFRIRTSRCEKGKRVDVGAPITLVSGKTYLFDNFQK